MRVATFARVMIPLLAAAAPLAGQQVVLVPAGATWRYLDDGSDQGAGWREPGFDDSGWSMGPAQLGYGDGDERTVVNDGGATRFITTYFRHHFTVTDPGAYGQLLVRILRDDAAVVYLNGARIFRNNLPAGEPDYLTPAATTVGGSDEDRFYFRAQPADVLVAGDNVLAVEVHQVSTTSSDVSFDLELRATPAAAFVTRGPYLQCGGPDRMVVRWRTDVATDSCVRYGTAPDQLTEMVEDAAVMEEHELTLTALTAGTRYYYTVGSTGELLVAGPALSFRTAPATGSKPPVRVWAIGDSGTADLFAEQVRDAFLAESGGAAPDVWLMLGDNAYDDGTDVEYQSAVFDLYRELLGQVCLWPTLGNHDSVSADSPSLSGPYYDAFTLPTAGEAGGRASGTEAYYSFDHANIHFVCLDSDDTNRAADGAMMQWLTADLDDTLADWIIAFWHHPPYTKGSHDSDDASDSGGRMRDMRRVALPILEAGGVDLVLTGHSHSYERSFLLDGHYGPSGTLISAMILDGGDGRRDGDGAYAKPAAETGPHEGAVYVVAGSSGKISGGPLNHPAMYTSRNAHGSVVLDVEGDRLAARFIERDGTVGDHFTIVKAAAALSGDLNGNCAVEFDDLLILLGAFDTTGGGDTDGDGDTDLDDLRTLLAAFGDTCG